MSHAKNKRKNIALMKALCMNEAYSPSDLARMLSVDRTTVHSYLREEADSMIPEGDAHGKDRRYRWQPTQDDVLHATNVLKAAGYGVLLTGGDS